MPEISLINALPCDIEIQITQLGDDEDDSVGHDKSMSLHEDTRIKSSKGALDLFFLPDSRRHDANLLHNRNISKFCDPFTNIDFIEPFLSISVKSGERFAIPCLAINKHLVFRIRVLPNSNVWSMAYIVPAQLFAHRYSYCKHDGEDISWDYAKNYNLYAKRGPQVRFIREWNHDSRSIVFYSLYWIINKTGILLQYQSKESSATMTLRPNDSLEKSSLLHQWCQQGQSTSSDKGAYLAHPVRSISLEYNDELQAKFLNRYPELTPVMMCCPSRYLSILPYKMMPQFQDAKISSSKEEKLYLYDMKCYDANVKVVVLPGIANNKSVYIDSSWCYMSWPSLLISEHNSKSTFTIKFENQARHFECDTEGLLSFRLSADSFVYVCVDSRCKKPPKWMIESGFECATNERIRTSCVDTVYQVYRKFYKGVGSTVYLGANNMIGGQNTVQAGSTVNMYLVFCVKADDMYHEPTLDCVHVDKEHQVSTKKLIQFEIKSHFRKGDTVYCKNSNDDHILSIVKLPELLIYNISAITSIKLRNCDCTLITDKFISFQVNYPTRIILCVDDSIPTHRMPTWISKRGFTDIPNEQIHAMDYLSNRIVKFRLYSRSFSAQTCILGGVNSWISKEKPKWNYFVLALHEDEFIANFLSTENAKNELSYQTCSVAQDDDQNHSFSIKESLETSIHNFWSRSFGPLKLQEALFDVQGRQWSQCFDMATGNSGELNTSCCTFAVSISHLPGVFRRTSVVRLLPRYAVVNSLSTPLLIWPEKGIHNYHIGQFHDTSRHRFHYSQVSHNHGVYLPAHTTLMLYSYYDFEVSSASKYSDTSLLASTSAMLSDMTEKNLKKRWIRLTDASCDGEASSTNLYDHNFADISTPILVDDVGQSFVWLPCHQPKLLNPDNDIENDSEENTSDVKIISASILTENMLVVVTICDISNNPPYRIENRTSSIELQISQFQHSTYFPIAPSTWSNFLWPDQYGVKEVRISLRGNESVCSVPFRLDEIGAKDAFSWNESDDNSSLIGNMMLSDNNPLTTIGIYIFAEGSTKVLVLYEVMKSSFRGNLMRSFSTFASPVKSSYRIPQPLKPTKPKPLSMIMTSRRLSGPSRAVGWTDLWQSLILVISLPGINLNLFTEGKDISLDIPSVVPFTELLSISLDGISFTYDSVIPAVEFSIYHFQIDDMRELVRFPVVCVPTDSGLNSHMRERISDFEPKQISCFRMRMLWKLVGEDVNVMHISDLEILLQDLSLKLDMDLVVLLVGLIGSITRDLGSKVTSTTTLKGSNSESLKANILRGSIRAAQHHIAYTISSKVKHATDQMLRKSLVYIEMFHHSSIVICSEVCLLTYTHTHIESNIYLFIRYMWVKSCLILTLHLLTIRLQWVLRT